MKKLRNIKMLVNEKDNNRALGEKRYSTIIKE